MIRKKDAALQAKKAETRDEPKVRSVTPIQDTVAETIVVLSPETRGKRSEKALSLAHQLRDLRSALNEVIEHLKLKLNSRLVQMAEALQGSQNEDEPAPLPSAKVLKAVEQKLLKLKLKPAQGRLKDLRRLQEVIRAISKTLN